VSSPAVTICGKLGFLVWKAPRTTHRMPSATLVHLSRRIARLSTLRLVMRNVRFEQSSWLIGSNMLTLKLLLQRFRHAPTPAASSSPNRPLFLFQTTTTRNSPLSTSGGHKVLGRNLVSVPSRNALADMHTSSRTKPASSCVQHRGRCATGGWRQSRRKSRPCGFR
jgi:hypothetical protein